MSHLEAFAINSVYSSTCIGQLLMVYYYSTTLARDESTTWKDDEYRAEFVIVCGGWGVVRV